MMKFEDTWSTFSWVADELSSGMTFFEGNIPVVCMADIESCLQELAMRCVSRLFKSDGLDTGTNNCLRID